MKLKQTIITACASILLMSACSSTKQQTSPESFTNAHLAQYKLNKPEAIAEYEFAAKHAQKYTDLITEITEQGKKVNWPTHYLTKQVGTELTEILDKYSEKNQQKEFAAELLELTPSTAFDQAYIEHILGKLYAQQSDYPTALHYLEKSTQSFILGQKTYVDVLKNIATLYLATQNFEQAQRYYYQYIRYQGFAEPMVYDQLAFIHYQQNEFILAAMAAQRAMEPKSSNNSQLIMQLSAWQQLDMHYNSLLVAHQQQEYAPKSALYLNNLANLYDLVDDYNNIIKYRLLSYEYGQRKTNGNQKQLSSAYSFSGQHELALSTFLECKKQKICKESSKNSAHLAFLHMQAGNIATAEKEYQLLFATTQDYQYLNDIAAMYLRSENLSKTKVIIEQALQNPTSNETKHLSYKILAQLHALQKNYQSANAALQQIPTSSPYFEQTKRIVDGIEENTTKKEFNQI